MPATPEAKFEQILLASVYKRPSQISLAKLLSNELERDGLTMHNLLEKLRKDIKAEEFLNSSIASEVTVKEVGNDKKGKPKATANQAFERKECPECGQNHELSQCPRAQHKMDKDAYQRGQHMPGPESPGGRGGRGGFANRGGSGPWRGRGRGGRGGFQGGIQGGTQPHSEPNKQSAQNAHYQLDPKLMCYMCLSMGHRGGNAYHQRVLRKRGTMT